MKAAELTVVQDAIPVGQALKYAALLGWYVFPVRPGDKVPRTHHGHLEATLDQNTIRDWWNQRPDANIGIACEPSGLVVIDLDGEEGLEAWRELRATLDIPDQTVTCLTPHGEHLYYKVATRPIRNSAGKLAENIDIRGAGGYAVVPPSRLGDGLTYRL